ncbi:hypothetical protein F5Y04DRAFT_278364 [Hypomontagnella monticulosa]|nr:hypothetical protein F5Y04DRAFT_278364 [Hypomontagnella monticulosa]
MGSTQDNSSIAGLSSFADLVIRSRAINRATMPRTEDLARYVLVSLLCRIVHAGPSSVTEAETGLLYELGNGARTWFCPHKDFLLWGGFDVALGQLGSVVQNIVIPRELIGNYPKACETFQMLLENGGLRQLKNIYVDVGNKFTLIDDDRLQDELFSSSSIIVPDLGTYDNRMARIDDAAPMLPADVLGHWYKHKTMVLNNEQEWEEMSGDIMYAWITTKACLSGEISGQDYDDFEAGVLMHPSGRSWWDYFAESAPTIRATCVFAQIAETERLNGEIKEGDDLLSGIFTQ